MMNYLTANFDEIIADANKRGVEATNFLNEIINTKTVDKNGKERSISFLAVKKAYFKQYLPDLIPQPKAKKLTKREKMAQQVLVS